MDNVQKCESFSNMSSSQAIRSYLLETANVDCIAFGLGELWLVNCKGRRCIRDLLYGAISISSVVNISLVKFRKWTKNFSKYNGSVRRKFNQGPPECEIVVYWTVIVVALSHDICESIGTTLPIVSPSFLEPTTGQCWRQQMTMNGRLPTK
jgi:hypothetical protein